MIPSFLEHRSALVDWFSSDVFHKFSKFFFRCSDTFLWHTNLQYCFRRLIRDSFTFIAYAGIGHEKVLKEMAEETLCIIEYWVQKALLVFHYINAYW